MEQMVSMCQSVVETVTEEAMARKGVGTACRQDIIQTAEPEVHKY